jgi:sialidase-1
MTNKSVIIVTINLYLNRKSMNPISLICIVLLFFLNGGCTQSDAGGQWPDSQLLFAADKTTVPEHEDGIPVKDMYQCFREPVTIKTNTGRIIVGCHAGNKLDWPERSGQDYVIKYSDDGGKTWSAPVLVAEHGNHSVQSHGMVYNGESDRIIVKYIVYRWDYSKVEGRGWEASAPVLKEVADAGEDFSRQYEVFSDDDGVSWSTPREIPVINKHGIPHYGSSEGRQLSTGEHKGRLIIPGGIKVEEMGKVVKRHVGIWLSDDHGENWKFTEISQNDSSSLGCEARVSELNDGSLLYNVRTNYKRRYLSRSTDGGETWSVPRAHPDLEATKCNGSMITIRDKKGKLTSSLLFSIPSPGGRKDGWIYVSKDGGESWPLKHQPVDGYFAYSSLIQVDQDTVCLFYEANHYKDIRHMLIPLKKLLDE